MFVEAPAPEHPAKFSKGIVPLMAELLASNGVHPDELVVDPFAGTGLIHDLPGYDNTVGVEIEHEWADMHPRTVCGDSRGLSVLLGWLMLGHRDTPPPPPGDPLRIVCAVESFRAVGAIATSCTYGNRMADHHVARDGSKRMTYTHRLGRQLTDGNSGKMQWGEEYQELHRRVWDECDMVLRERGLLILNCSNHFRAGATGPYVAENDEVNVTGWHVDYLRNELGYELIEAHAIRTRRMRFGKKSRRTEFEWVMAFRKPLQPEGEE